MKIFITIFAILITGLCAKGQQSVPEKFTAKVTDGLNEPLAGVTITVAGKPSGTVSDPEGNFTVYAGENDVVQFSYIGFETAELPVYEIEAGMQNQVRLTGSAFLNEVVITASPVELVRFSTTTCCYIWDGNTHATESGDSSAVSGNIDNSSLKILTFYPNPTIDAVMVATPEATGVVTVFTTDGSIAGQTKVVGPQTKVDMTMLPAATYILHFDNNKSGALAGKVVRSNL